MDRRAVIDWQHSTAISVYLYIPEVSVLIFKIACACVFAYLLFIGSYLQRLQSQLINHLEQGEIICMRSIYLFLAFFLDDRYSVDTLTFFRIMLIFYLFLTFCLSSHDISLHLCCSCLTIWVCIVTVTEGHAHIDTFSGL